MYLKKTTEQVFPLKTENKAILFVIYHCFRISHISKELAKKETLYFRMEQYRGYQYYNFIHLDYKMIFTIGYVAILLNSKFYMH